MYSQYYGRSFDLLPDEKEALLDIYEDIAREQGFEPDYEPEDREYIDFESYDADLWDTVLYHVENFGKNHPRFGEVAEVFNEERELEMDGDLENEVEISVEGVERADEHYLDGFLVVNGEKFPFDYNLETEAVDVHCYSEPGWMTGASYEKPLPEVVTEHMEDVLGAVSEAVEDWMKEQGFVKLSVKTVDELVANAGMAARDANASKGAKVLSFVDEIGYTQFSVDAGWYEKQKNKEDIESLFEKATYDEIGSRFKDLTGKYWEPELDM